MNEIWNLDVEGFKAIHLGLHRDFLDPVFLLLSHSGAEAMWVVLLGALILMKDSRRQIWLALCSAALAGLIRLPLADTLIRRERPSNFAFSHPLEPVFGATSFPSGHTTTSFAAAAAFYLCTKGSSSAWIGQSFLIWASLVGLSRIYVGVHFPTDVLGGALLGTAGALTVYWLFDLKGWLPTSGDVGLPADEG